MNKFRKYKSLSGCSYFKIHIYTYIYMDILKWIGPQVDLFSKLFIFLLHMFPVFALSSGRLYCLMAAVSLIYIVPTVLIRLLFFLIPDFFVWEFSGGINALIVYDKFSLFFPSFSFSLYEIIFYVCVSAWLIVSMYMYTYFVFFPLK